MIISVIDAAQGTSDRQEAENQVLIISKVTSPLRDMQENANTYVNAIDGSVLLVESLIYSFPLFHCNSDSFLSFTEINLSV